MKKMTKERLEWLKANRPPIITLNNGNKIKAGKLNVRDAMVDFENNYFKLHHLTEKGYNSKKPLFIDLLTIDRIEFCRLENEDFDRRFIVLTDEEAKYLKENFSQFGKIYQTPEQKARIEKMAGMRALAERIDIHDRG